MKIVTLEDLLYIPRPKKGRSPLLVPCPKPKCGARVGEPCRSVVNPTRPVVPTHKARLRA